MSCCNAIWDRSQTSKSKAIDETIKQDRKKHVLKLLLLGTGDSGKSTFAKQMTIIHKDGFSDNKRMSSIPVLRGNALDSMKIMITACNDWNFEMPEELKASAEEVIGAFQLTEDIGKIIFALWNSEPIRKAYDLRYRIQLPGGASTTNYYFDNVIRFSSSDFIPSIDDMLRAKVKTTGILETRFDVNGTEFVMVDVGGQRSERKKWLSCFNDVSAVIYLVALNEYDMLMEEDNTTNRMEESIKLFEKLSGSQWLKDSATILFLNKADLFEEKIKVRPLNTFFQDFEDFVKRLTVKRNVFEASCEYIKEQYAHMFKGARLYTFITCTLDTTNCEKVFVAVRDAIMAKVFQETF